MTLLSRKLLTNHVDSYIYIYINKAFFFFFFFTTVLKTALHDCLPTARRRWI
jgi:hypothetical protein